MTLREKFDDIFNSIMNGQLRQAGRQMDRLTGDERADLIDYFNDDLNDPDTAQRAAIIYFRGNWRRSA